MQCSEYFLDMQWSEYFLNGKNIYSLAIFRVSSNSFFFLLRLHLSSRRKKREQSRWPEEPFKNYRTSCACCTETMRQSGKLWRENWRLLSNRQSRESLMDSNLLKTQWNSSLMWTNLPFNNLKCIEPRKVGNNTQSLYFVLVKMYCEYLISFVGLILTSCDQALFSFRLVRGYESDAKIRPDRRLV